MPITAPFHFVDYSQPDFARLAYDVVGKSIEVHRSLTRLASERVYGRALESSLGDSARSEVRITVSHRGYSKDYFVDLVVGDGAVFELKRVTALTEKHRSQLLHYLMLTNTSHGKLINFGGSKLEHEFVNCLQSKDERCRFAVDDSRLQKDDVAVRFKEVLVELLSDWGTGLDTSLYEEAIGHLFAGGADRHSLPITFSGSLVGEISVNILEPGVGFYVTALNDAGRQHFEGHARRLLQQSSLCKLQWANVRVGSLSLVTLY